MNRSTVYSLRGRWLHLAGCAVALVVMALSATPGWAVPPLSDAGLLEEAQHRAFLFFVEKSDATTGLTQDRADKNGNDHFDMASIAATGYALAALPVGVEHGWMTRSAAQARALATLRFLGNQLPNEHGFFYHFINKQTGARAWSSEVSSIDTGILLCGALACGQYFGEEAERLANTLYDRVDWMWLLTNGGEKPNKLLLGHGWLPEKGFIPHDYDYCEALLIYLLALGSGTHPIPARAWDALGRPSVSYAGLKALAGGAIFMHQMPHNFFAMQNRCDRLGYDYWASSSNATLINRQLCIDHMGQRRTYGTNFWGLNASDGPDGYRAYGAPQGPEDGTLSPTGAMASMPFTPALCSAAAQAIYNTHGDKLWGRYGFGNAYNVDRNWFDSEVIGIDLGMALLAIENWRNGLIWRLVGAHPATVHAYQSTGLWPAIRRLDPPEKDFFSKGLDFHGISIKAHQVVADEALYAAYGRLSLLFSNLLTKQPMVISNLVAAGAELHIIGRDQVTTDLPEWRHDKGKPLAEYNGLTRDERTRGMGGRLTSCGEENLLKLDKDRYRGRDICLHEFSHNIRNHGIQRAVRTRFDEQYRRSLQKGLWQKSYAGSNPDEFFAELTMWYFGTHGDLHMTGPKPANGPEGLRSYDPDAYALLDDFYGGRIEITKVER